MNKIEIEVDKNQHYHMELLDDGADTIDTAVGEDITAECEDIRDELNSILAIGKFEPASNHIEKPSAKMSIVLVGDGGVYFQSKIPFVSGEQERLQNALYTIVYGIAAWHGLSVTWDCKPPFSLKNLSNVPLMAQSR